ncbi:RpiB/LacA/LacB family sugar-phosphate isomerase [Phycisphaera mikurensis]|uniref:Ribose-5-phosphate isomerase B n=1 Tax=Phycisphaera mikurensis (strain NBRC 102666 / KCTC 22515 / FYK2301M01) TaxID=1142394 RepID=I0IHS2_PHYMF|nr:RpiB/LacA/LacB family sugar-phosphate isomerase [Phycisphaera mikurensis]MBB6441054.1 ribose 5-phosphate isomerase B [Phycisphaera mikurensis]BAM04810.1 ribose-5-phosphate isomerase B [Phycisphaera mikurensis NBRC 102666]
MKVAVAADHGGFSHKQRVVEIVRAAGHEAVDLGAHELDPADDYPDFAERVGRAIQRGEAERAILLCGSGVGACIAANKLDGVRASVCHDVYSAHQGVEHDDMNVLCLGARIIGPALLDDLVEAFLKAELAAGERFRRRLDKVAALEAAR